MSKTKQNEALSASTDPIWALPDGDLFTHLGADVKQGLSAAQAAGLLQSFGPNAIAYADQTPASPSVKYQSWRQLLAFCS